MTECSRRGADPDPAVQLLTVTEARSRLRVGKTKMFQLIRSGEVESIRIGRSRRVVEKSLANYCDRQRTAKDSSEPKTVGA